MSCIQACSIALRVKSMHRYLIITSIYLILAIVLGSYGQGSNYSTPQTTFTTIPTSASTTITTTAPSTQTSTILANPSTITTTTAPSTFNSTTLITSSPSTILSTETTTAYSTVITTNTSTSTMLQSSTSVATPISNVTPTISPTTSIKPSTKFYETGLPYGTPWQVVGGIFYGTASAPNAISINGTAVGTNFYVLPAVSNMTIYYPAPESVNLNGNNVAISFTSPVLQNTTKFVESGLPNNTVWGVMTTYSNNSTSTGPTLRAIAPDPIMWYYPLRGNYFYKVYPSYAFDQNAAQVFYPDPAYGIATSGNTVNIAFNAIVQSKYLANFYEKGLPAGALWQVVYGKSYGEAYAPNAISVYSTSSTNDTFIVLPNLANSSVYYPSPSIGSIAQGSNVLINFSSPYVQNTTRFVARGLPNNTLWDVKITVKGSAQTLTLFGVTPAAITWEAYGQKNYSYAPNIAYVYNSKSFSSTDYYPSPSSGFAVPGNTLYINYSTTAPQNSLTRFYPIGLPAGARWSLIYNNTLYLSATPNSISAYSSESHSPSFIIIPVVYNGLIYNPSPSSGALRTGSSLNISFTITAAQTNSINISTVSVNSTASSTSAITQTTNTTTQPNSNSSSSGNIISNIINYIIKFFSNL